MKPGPLTNPHAAEFAALWDQLTPAARLEMFYLTLEKRAGRIITARQRKAPWFNFRAWMERRRAAAGR